LLGATFYINSRDNAPRGTAQTNTDEMTVNVSGTTGPFVITSQNTDNLSWFQGQSTINWSVNNTNTLPVLLM
jgi:hypothetical protein